LQSRGFGVVQFLQLTAQWGLYGHARFGDLSRNRTGSFRNVSRMFTSQHGTIHVREPIATKLPSYTLPPMLRKVGPWDTQNQNHK
jgi:hypothetical protein